MQMSKLRRIAETQTGVQDAYPVIAVPPGFSRHQRQAVVDACEIAGLLPPHLIDDTSAAALYYAFYSCAALPRSSNSESVEKNVLILDMGAGSTSASLAAIEGGIVEIRAASSNLNLGGESFDEAIATHVVAQLQSNNRIDFSLNPRARAIILSLAERARKDLSSAMTTTIDLEAVSRDGRPSSMTVTRDQIDLLCRDLYMEVLSLVNDVVQQAGLQMSQVHEVLLVGGATRTSAIIPALQSCISDDTAIYSIRNLDEAVALGAAIYGILKGHPAGQAMPETLEDMLLMDVVHEPLGVAILQGQGILKGAPTLPADGGSPHECMLEVIVPRNTTFPCRKTSEFSIPEEGEGTAHIQVYQGENKQPTLNAFLGSFELHDIPIAVPGRGRTVTVDFDINADSSVVVSVQDSNRRKRSMVIRVGTLSKGDKEVMKQKARALDGMSGICFGEPFGH